MITDKIYPDYELHYNNLFIDIKTNVRKQREDGQWFLIPVIKNYELYKNIKEEDRIPALLEAIKSFHDDCYRCLLFYILYDDVNYNKLKSIDGKTLIEKDNNIKTEKERLLL